MKKILIFGALSFAFFVPTPTHTAKLDTKGKAYWTVEFKKVGKATLPLLGNYSLTLTSDTTSISLQPGDIGKLHRDKNFKVRAKLHYYEVKGVFGRKFETYRQHYSYQTKFDTKYHYVTIKVVANPWKLWTTPKLHIYSDKKNDGLENRASTRFSKFQSEWNKKFMSGCTGREACERRRQLQHKMQILR